jgi:hypothetical protein
MKAHLLSLICLLLVSTAFSESLPAEVVVHLSVQPNSVQWDRAHTSVTFMCEAAIENRTRDPLTVTNLFQDHAGLFLKIMDKHGTELSRLWAAPFHTTSFTIPAGARQTFSPYYGIMNRFDPGTNETVSLQFQGKLNGSSYTKALASNILDLKLPKGN